MFIEWSGVATPITCPVCGWSGTAEAAANFTDPLDAEYTAHRCSDCGSLVILDYPKDSSPDESSIDHYLEYGAGIGTIIEELGRVDPATVRSFLDVGCNFGYSLDFARSIFDWDVLGIEPSGSGVRGASELGVEIVHDYLLEGTDLGRKFDLILSSEVLEHVPDPVGFLHAIKAQLAEGGAVLLTTPDAEVVGPGHAESDALIALSPGYHVFLATAKSLEALLTRVGFGWVSVTREGLSLRAMARVESSPPPEGQAIAPELVERYYRDVVERSSEPSSLRLGMAARLLRSTVARGAFDDVDILLPSLRELVSAVYGVDIDSPDSELRSVAETVPGALPGISFALGMYELLHHENFSRAADYFGLSSRATDLWFETLGHPDLDLIDLREQSAYHRLLALARVEPQWVVPGAVELAEQSPLDRASGVRRLLARRARLLVELTAHDPDGDHSVLVGLVSPDVRDLALSGDEEERVAARDGLYALGLEAIRRGEHVEARRWLGAAIDVCRPEAPVDGHARGLIDLCEATLAQLEPLGAAAPEVEEVVAQAPLARRVFRRIRPTLGRIRRRVRKTARGVVRSETSDISHMLDVYWCNTNGTFLQGWAHVAGVPADTLVVRHGGAEVVAEKLDREDLLAHWPATPAVVRSGFSAYLPGPPEPSTEWVLRIGNTEHVLRMAAPRHPLPVLPPVDDAAESTLRIQNLIAAAPPGRVLALGVRSSDEAGAQRQRLMFGDREVIGVDIHPGFGVDVIADAHRLSSVFDAGSFAVVYSGSVLEHVSVPWLVARESAIMLMNDGIAVNNVPWLWPTHSEPNDFWRFSQQGLELLYGPDLGFEVVDSGAIYGTRSFPEPDWIEQSLSHATLVSASTSWSVSRKISDAALSIEWPYDPDTGQRLAENYPVDGLGL